MHETLADRLAELDRQSDLFGLLDLAYELQEQARKGVELPDVVLILDTLTLNVAQRLDLPESIQQQIANIAIQDVTGESSLGEIRLALRALAEDYRAMMHKATKSSP